MVARSAKSLTWRSWIWGGIGQSFGLRPTRHRHRLWWIPCGVCEEMSRYTPDQPWSRPEICIAARTNGAGTPGAPKSSSANDARASYQASEGYVVEFTVRRADITAERPRGISYALVFRPAHGEPFVRFDNAHAPNRTGGKYVKARAAYDHWHRDEHDVGRPYTFTTALQLLNDFWREVKRVMDERGIPNDL